uniref:GIR1-like zinc ribbon domain-containing protein n=1 Tax=Oryza meridionalis TaxID=40149 RepID=A0A0E0D486_9ORYZ
MVAGALGYMARAADGGRAAELVTRDFLGGCVAADDARDAAAATARHDSVSGKLSLQKQTCPATPRDLNLFPVPGAAASAAKPCPSSTAAAAAAASGAGGTTTTTTYHSVCTIEKVKTALERFERGKHQHHQHQQHSAGASPSSSSVTTSSVKRRGGGGGSVGDGAVEQGDGCDSPSAAAGGGMVAAACPRCFLYVLISRSDPRCPRCESHVPPPPSPAPKKKPRIDLNVGFLGT